MSSSGGPGPTPLEPDPVGSVGSTAPVALVTGASRGIGAAVAALAAARGYAVCVNYASDRAAAESVVAGVEALGGTARAVRADVASEADVLALFRAGAELGPITLVVNNAATAAGYGPLADLDAAATLRMLEVNVLGTILCCREAVRSMATSRGGAGGCIVNISSGAARHGGATEWVDYAASKGAIDTLTMGLAREVASEGIRVNCVRPGLVDTDFNLHAPAGRAERITPSIPMGRIGTPAEIADAVLWLASPGASFTTGAILDVSGGR